jgi:hypothetical protein
MSVFRPAARVTAPDGQEWEIYAYKVRVRDRPDPDPLDVAPGYSKLGPEWAALDALLYALLLVPRALLRLVDVTVAAARAVRSDEWTVDAVAYVPQQTVYSWATTTEYKGQVLAQVEGSLARGDIATRLTNATYLGESRSAR